MEGWFIAFSIAPTRGSRSSGSENWRVSFPTRIQRSKSSCVGRHSMNPQQCAIRVPVAQQIAPGCEKGLRQLEPTGYPIWRVYGFAAIECLPAHDLEMAAAVYPKKGEPALACQVLPGTGQFVLGRQGGLVEILSVGSGFLSTRRRPDEDVSMPVSRFPLPLPWRLRRRISLHRGPAR